MTLGFAAKLGLSTKLTGISSFKINAFTPKTYGMAITKSPIQDKSGWIWFLKETFLLADTSIEIVLRISFLNVNIADIYFDAKSFN